MPTANPILRYSPAGAVLQEVSPAVVTTPTVDEEATSPSPIITYPGGGFAAGEFPPSSVVSQTGITPLVNGQSYIEVGFGHTQVDTDWIFVECAVLNTTDSEPLNIWPGIITSKTVSGFRLQLNGMPDSNNYFLNWAISGVNIVPSPATTFLLSGPASGPLGAPSTFTVYLPSDSTVPETVVVTPSDGGGGGTFTPASVGLTTGTPSATFTYTPGAVGTKTVSVTNDGELVNPGSVTFAVLPATGYSMTGPSSGDMSVPSTPFTVTLTPSGYGVPAPVTVTPNDGGGGGAFTPTTVILSTGSPSGTFTYTPTSGGTKTIAATNSGGLTNPTSLSYFSVAPFDPSLIAGLKLWLKADSLALSDGATVTAWNDSSVNAYNVTNVSGTPKFRTSIVNSKPVVRFNAGTTDIMAGAADISVSQPDTIFVVGAATSPGTESAFIHNGANQILSVFTNNKMYLYAGVVEMDSATIDSAFHLFAGIYSGANGTGYIDGVQRFGPGSVGAAAVGTVSLGGGAGIGSPCDIAEVIIYNSVLSTTDREAVEGYLRTKYALP